VCVAAYGRIELRRLLVGFVRQRRPDIARVETCDDHANGRDGKSCDCNRVRHGRESSTCEPVLEVPAVRLVLLALVRPADMAAIATAVQLIRQACLRIGDGRFEEARAAAICALERRVVLRLWRLLLHAKLLPSRFRHKGRGFVQRWPHGTLQTIARGADRCRKVNDGAACEPARFFRSQPEDALPRQAAMA
jgi:hypothetical protein